MQRFSKTRTSSLLCALCILFIPLRVRRCARQRVSLGARPEPSPRAIATSPLNSRIIGCIFGGKGGDSDSLQGSLFDGPTDIPDTRLFCALCMLFIPLRVRRCTRQRVSLGVRPERLLRCRSQGWSRLALGFENRWLHPRRQRRREVRLRRVLHCAVRVSEARLRHFGE